MPFRFNPCQPCCTCAYSINIVGPSGNYDLLVNNTVIPSSGNPVNYSFSGQGSKVYPVSYTSSSCIPLNGTVTNTSNKPIFVNDAQVPAGQSIFLDFCNTCPSSCQCTGGLIDVECQQPGCTCMTQPPFLWVFSQNDSWLPTVTSMNPIPGSSCFYHGSFQLDGSTWNAVASSREYSNSILTVIGSGIFNAQEYVDTYNQNVGYGAAYTVLGQTATPSNAKSCSPCLYSKEWTFAPDSAGAFNPNDWVVLLSYSNNRLLFPCSPCSDCYSIANQLFFTLDSATITYCSPWSASCTQNVTDTFLPTLSVPLTLAATQNNGQFTYYSTFVDPIIIGSVTVPNANGITNVTLTLELISVKLVTDSGGTEQITLGFAASLEEPAPFYSGSSLPRAISCPSEFTCTPPAWSFNGSGFIPLDGFNCFFTSTSPPLTILCLSDLSFEITE